MNPYEVLGIDRDADFRTIRKAYRRAVMQHHPDKGGDPKVFEYVQLAHDVLTDPDRRAHFDQTGQFSEEKAPDHLMATIVTAFNMAVGTVIARGQEPEYADLIKEMIAALELAETGFKEQLPPLENGLKRLAKLSGRFTPPEGRPDFFNTIIQGQISDINNRLRPIHENVERLRAGRLYLDACQFRMEKMEMLENITINWSPGFDVRSFGFKEL